ncbi:VP1 [Gokushovirus WZ-2015a]|nr:VP1 [Gokushovirus WZ-2015a]
MSSTSAARWRNRVAHQFSQAPQAQIGRSRFRRSHGYTSTFKPDYLYPILFQEVLPGDTWKVRTVSITRVEAMLKPIMDSLYCETFYFFVPYRLVWDNFQKFMGEQDNPDDSIDFLLPTFDKTWLTQGSAARGEGSLWDYFGLPPGYKASSTSTALPICSLWFRAYNLIWNQWFRDQNLQDSVNVPKGDGPDDLNSLFGASNGLLKRAKPHDYFTSALPWPQKGPAVDIPLGDVAPVWTVDGSGLKVQALGHTSVTQTVNLTAGDNAMRAKYLTTNETWNSANSGEMLIPKDGNLKADLSEATAVSINSLRQAFQLQKFYERMALGGSRYIEILKAHFGVTSPDARLQRAEYLGGNSKPLTFNTVAQTSSTDSTSPQANLTAYGFFGGDIGGFTRSFVEHGVIIGLVNWRSDLKYQQGVHRDWVKRTREDFYWPTFAHLGEQTILNHEIYTDGSANDSGVFGYQERYAEYRYAQSLVTGEMRSSAAQSLDIYHLAQDFEALPKLNGDFIQSAVPMARVVAVQDKPPFLGDFWHEIECVRPMPLYGTPGLVDHF